MQMRWVLAVVALGVLFVPASCGSDSTSGSGGKTSGGGGAPDGSVGGSIGSGASWPGGGTAGASQGGVAGIGSGGVSGQGGGAAGTAAGGSAACGAAASVQCGTGGPCSFPQGVPDPDFINVACTYQDTDSSVDAAVNSVMASLSGCGVGSDCTITGFAGTTIDEICQSWFAAVTQELRAQGFCAGQHSVGSTDEIAVSNTCCEGKWYGYHICNYGGGKVVWNPGARRGWWMITPSYCSP